MTNESEKTKVKSECKTSVRVIAETRYTVPIPDSVPRSQRISYAEKKVKELSEKVTKATDMDVQVLIRRK